MAAAEAAAEAALAAMAPPIPWAIAPMGVVTRMGVL